MFNDFDERKATVLTATAAAACPIHTSLNLCMQCGFHLIKYAPSSL